MARWGKDLGRGASKLGKNGRLTGPVGRSSVTLDAEPGSPASLSPFKMSKPDQRSIMQEKLRKSLMGIGNQVVSVRGAATSWSSDVGSGGGDEDVGAYNAATYGSVQAAINAALNNGGGRIYVPKGTWNENIILYDNMELYGDGRTLSIINNTSTTVPNIRVRGSNVIIRNILVQGVGAAGTASGIYFVDSSVDAAAPANVANLTVRDVYIAKTAYWGIYIDGANAFNTMFQNVTQESAYAGGGLFIGNGTTHRSTVCQFAGPAYGTFGNSSLQRGAIHVQNLTTGEFDGCIYENGGTYNPGTDQTYISIGSPGTSCYNIIVRGGHCERESTTPTGNAYFCTTSGYVNNLVIDGLVLKTLNPALTTKGARLLRSDSSGGGGLGSILADCSIRNVYANTYKATMTDTSEADIYSGNPAYDTVIVHASQHSNKSTPVHFASLIPYPTEVSGSWVRFMRMFDGNGVLANRFNAGTDGATGAQFQLAQWNNTTEPDSVAIGALNMENNSGVYRLLVYDQLGKFVDPMNVQYSAAFVGVTKKGTLWYDTGTSQLKICTTDAPAAAVWSVV